VVRVPQADIRGRPLLAECRYPPRAGNRQSHRRIAV